ncbi:hypothetical protein H4Q26_013360 [Puccinia striiformis f. sp. tritici PST-130]|nr:hypothetical protein H4Q26_013360 [Puccinia striiformis f. sp. tritici PST-130]
MTTYESFFNAQEYAALVSNHMKQKPIENVIRRSRGNHPQGQHRKNVWPQKEKAARSQLVVPSVIPLDTTPEESSLTRTEVPTPNLESNSTRPENSTFKPLPLPTTLIPTLPSSEIDDTLFVDPASIPLPDDGHPLNLPRLWIRHQFRYRWIIFPLRS